MCSLAKCDSVKLSHIIENYSNDLFNLTIINVQLNNPDNEAQVCEMTNVNNCYAIYPSMFFAIPSLADRFILYFMYTCCVVIVCGVSAIYIILYNRKPSLPITEPTPSAPAKPAATETEQKPCDNSSEEKKEPIATVQTTPGAN